MYMYLMRIGIDLKCIFFCLKLHMYLLRVMYVWRHNLFVFYKLDDIFVLYCTVQ